MTKRDRNRQPSPADPKSQPEVRAYPRLDSVPLGHFLHKVGSDNHEPHIHVGEFVVIDANDREIAVGELYGIVQSNGPVLWQIRDCPGVSKDLERAYLLCPLETERPMPGTIGGIKHQQNLSDGPYLESRIKAMLLGRVVALFDPQMFAHQQWREGVHAQVEREQGAKRARRAGT